MVSDWSDGVGLFRRRLLEHLKRSCDVVQVVTASIQTRFRAATNQSRIDFVQDVQTQSGIEVASISVMKLDVETSLRKCVLSTAEQFRIGTL